MPISVATKPLRVSIIGAGPGGLGAAIAFSALQDVEVTIYEQARELGEAGAGISIGPNTWTVLRLLGADVSLTSGHVTAEVQNLNGKTGEILSSRVSPSSPDVPASVRTQRTALQKALLAHVPPGVIKLRKRLLSIVDLGQEGVRLHFEDGEEVISDLVVGADGIRSVVRNAIFPKHGIRFTGTTIWRTLQPLSAVSHLSECTKATSWWHGPNGHIYYSEVGEDKWEIAARAVEDPSLSKVTKVSWGVPVKNERVESHFMDYHPFVREALKLVPDGEWKEFSAFAGKELDHIVEWDKVALVGDSSHPLSGAFGSGAAFALEDGYILAKAINHYRTTEDPDFIPKGLALFNDIRSPYYHRMYRHLAVEKAKTAAARHQEDLSWDALVRAKVKPLEGESMAWIYENDIEKVWQEAESEL